MSPGLAPLRIWCARLMQCSKTKMLFDHLVGDGEQSVRKSEAKHPCGLCVDNQLELVCLHDRQVLRRRALENAAGINASLTPTTHNIRPVAHQPTGFGVV